MEKNRLTLFGHFYQRKFLVKNVLKSYGNNKKYQKIKTKALCSGAKKTCFFTDLVGLFSKWTFINVQNRFPNNKPRFSIFL